jgi:predicted metalloprotease with PDZ domain
LKFRVINPHSVRRLLLFLIALSLFSTQLQRQVSGRTINRVTGQPNVAASGRIDVGGPFPAIAPNPEGQTPGSAPRADAQTSLTCRIDGVSPQNRAIAVNCAAAPPAGKFQLRFADQFAGVDRLSERVYGLKIRDDKGVVLPPEIRGDGVYFFDAPGRPVTIDYEMRLARALDPAQYALVSSLGKDAGFLMIGDLLPGLCRAGGSDTDCGPLDGRIRAQIVAPSGWRIATLEKAGAGDRGRDGYFEIGDPRRAVFFLGRLREKTVSVGAMTLRVAIAGEWSFPDEEVFRLAEAVAREQAAMAGGAAASDALVTLAPFPHPLTGLRSSAVTLGRANVLMLNPNNDAAATFAHYRRHLAHEMFHFYLPNAFRVRENFDWFWEGFTRYVALVTLARLRLIGLQEYLDALGVEYEAYWFNPLRGSLSLVAASPEKFASAANYDLVYRKGMLVAALYDLELRWQSRGQRDLTDVIRALYREYAIPGREIGNREVLDELRGAGDFSRLVRDDVENAHEIDLNQRINRYGLVMEWSAAGRGKARIKASAKLSARQQSLLSELAKDSAPPAPTRLP